MKKKYPNGVKVVVVDDHVAHAENEALDDCWTITNNPLSDHIHFDPIGLLLTSVQDITNDLISLTFRLLSMEFHKHSLTLKYLTSMPTEIQK